MKPFFDKEDFDKLRLTLRAHLSEIMPERDYRDDIFNLIHDVKVTARDIAEIKIASLIKENETLRKSCEEAYCKGFEAAQDHFQGRTQPKDGEDN